MPLFNQTPNPEAVRAFLDWVEDVTGIRPSEAGVVYAPVEMIPFSEVLDGVNLGAGIQAGMRFLAPFGDDVVSAEAGTGQPLRFRNLSRGDVAKSMLRRIREGGTIGAAREAEYKLTFLSIPNIFLDAVRLRTANSREDIILPVTSFGSDLSRDARLDAPEFFSIASKLARARDAHTPRRKPDAC